MSANDDECFGHPSMETTVENLTEVIGSPGMDTGRRMMHYVCDIVKFCHMC
jgi:hypothetical protein